MNRLKAFLHRLAHSLKMQRGEIILWWAHVPGFRPRAMTGFKCKTCGKVDGARAYSGPVPKELLKGKR